MIEMDKDMHSLRILIAQNELAFHILEKKIGTLLFTITEGDEKTPQVMFTNGNPMPI